jgi:TolB protein
MRRWIWILFAANAALAQPAESLYPVARDTGGGNYMFNYYFPPAPSSTPWAPAWSPDGKSIAVSMQGSIWKIDLATSLATELTSNARYHSSPTWSPDGRWIVFTAENDGHDIQLEIVNTATGEARALTADQHLYLDPVFSPDGTRLCYVSTRPDGRFNIFVRPIRDGQWAGEEIRLTPDNRFPRTRLYFSAWDINIEPAWTPDSKEIVFVSNRDVALGSGDVYRMPAVANGGAQAKLVLREQSLFRTRPDVSIDGKRILYAGTSGNSDQFNQLYVVPSAGGAPYKLTFQPHDHFHPRWSPDGEWIAYVSNEGGLPQLCLLETYGGAMKRIAIARRVWKRPMGRLHVKVLGPAGKAVAARVQYVSADGKFYPPADAYARIGGDSGKHLFHTVGEFTAEVPPGKLRLQVIKGFEFEPVEMDAGIEAGQTTEATVRLRRAVNMAEKGWYNGSTHVHMNYAGNLHNTLENLVMMSEAEDQQVLNELIANKDNRVLDWQYFVPGGGEHPVSRGKPGVKVVVGEEYRPPFWGHVFLIGLRDHLISPFTTGYEGTGIESLYPSNTDIFRKASAQGALTGYVHPFAGDRDPLDQPPGTLGEAKGFPVDAVLGTVNCLEWSQASHAGFTVWHHTLNNDLPIVPTGGEDSISSLHRTRLVGSSRTYVYTGKDFTVENWQEAVRQGHTFYTTGPLLEFRINGHIPGDVIHLPAGGGRIEISGSVTSLAPLSKVVIYNNGKVLKELPKSGRFQETMDVTHSGWYTLYAEGPADARLDARYPQATTNAVRVYVGEEKIRNAESAEYFMRWIDRLKELAGAWPGWRSDAERKHVFEQLDQARAAYARFR